MSVAVDCFRYYDPNIGRFLQQDPHPGKLSLPITVTNRYAYTGNNPINFTDPDGEFFFAALAISFVVGAGVAALQPGATLGSILTAGALTALSTAFVAGFSTGAVLLGAKFGLSSLGATIALGALGGGIGGAIVPALFGGTGTQIFLGALAGAISGGIIGGTLRAFPNAQGANTLNAADSFNRSITPSTPDYNFFDPGNGVPINPPR